MSFKLINLRNQLAQYLLYLQLGLVICLTDPYIILPGTAPSTLHLHLLNRCYQYPHFTDEETETGKGHITGPQAHTLTGSNGARRECRQSGS